MLVVSEFCSRLVVRLCPLVGEGKGWVSEFRPRPYGA